MSSDDFFAKIMGIVYENKSKNSKKSSSVNSLEDMCPDMAIPHSRLYSSASLINPFALNIKYDTELWFKYGDLLTRFSKQIDDRYMHSTLDDFREQDVKHGYLQVYTKQKREVIVDVDFLNYSADKVQNTQGLYGYVNRGNGYHRILGRKSPEDFYKIIHGFDHKDLNCQKCISVGITFGLKDVGTKWQENDYFPNHFYQFVYIVIFNDGSIYSDKNIEYFNQLPYEEVERLFNHISNKINNSPSWAPNRAYYFEVDVRDCIYSRSRKMRIL